MTLPATNIATLRDIDDPAARAREAHEYIERGRKALDQAYVIRRDAILQMRKTMSQRKVAAAVGLSPARVAQIEGEQQG